MYTKEQLKNDLINLGICSGDVILMHSSYKSLGCVEGGAATVFEAFFEVLGSEGTLILPALSFEYVTPREPVFNKQTTPSCVGYLTEFFRTQVPGVVRSLHATHSCCAWGKYACEIIENHEKDITPVGANSPFAKLPLYGGKILMLGCNPDRNTSMHGVEETIDPIPEYCLNMNVTVTYTLFDGENSFDVESHRHNFVADNGKHIEQCYRRIIDLLDGDEVSYKKVLEADCYLMDARAVWKKGKEKIEKDGLYFVEYPEN